MHDVDVIIVNYLSGEESRRAAESVAGPSTSIWIVDNSGELLDHPPAGVTVLGDGTNTMYAPASNLAFARGDAELVLLLNPDVVLDRAGLGNLVDELTADPSLWAVAPALDSIDDTPSSYLRRLPTMRGLLADLVPPLRVVFHREYRRYHCRDVDLRKSTLVEQPAAACLLVDRSKVGPTLFDEQYRLFFNDADLSRRMTAAGWACRYVASVHTTHVGGLSIERERNISGAWVSDEYDAAALRYARNNFRFGGALIIVTAARRMVRRLRSWTRRTDR